MTITGHEEGQGWVVLSWTMLSLCFGSLGLFARFITMCERTMNGESCNFSLVRLWKKKCCISDELIHNDIECHAFFRVRGLGGQQVLPSHLYLPFLSCSSCNE